MLEIRFFATLRKERDNSIKIDFTEGITGYEIINYFNISEAEVSIFLVNGFHTPLEKNLNDNDIISIFPPVGGG
ncbi:MAG: MoaD/ThiS family protein [Cetobacterium sp.]|uniref:MoaD/ThiS family protein n=1 Tax=unclassified Cetobacterium TaxID=2630983 RepID=UPI000647C40D|nr:MULTISPECIES: MoaD/ThiS family protein [unclassified Cetobacterium]